MLEVFLQSQTFRFPRGFLKFPSKCPGYIFGQGIIVGYGGASKMKGTPNKNPEVHHQVPNFTVFFNGNTTCRDKFMLAMVKSRITSYIIAYKYHCWWFQPNPSEKWWSSSVGMIIPNIWKNKKSKRPTKYIHIHIYIYTYILRMSAPLTLFLSLTCHWLRSLPPLRCGGGLPDRFGKMQQAPPETGN